MGTTDRTESEIAELYALPPEEFTGARDALARRLRADGDKAGAERVRALRRPSPALWAVNGLARTEPGAIAALLQAAEGLRSAQGRLLAGEPGAEMQRSVQAHRDAVSELAEAGRRLLEDAGRPATPAMMERIRRTLHSASLLEEARPLLAEGRLTGEVPVLGFGVEPLSEPRPGEGRRVRAEAVLENERVERQRRAEERRAAERAVDQAEAARDEALARLRAARSLVEQMEVAEAGTARALERARRGRADAERALTEARESEARAQEETLAAAGRTESARGAEDAARVALDAAQVLVEAARSRLRATDPPDSD